MEEKLKDKIVRLADEFACVVYPLTLKFPKIEQFALASQLRRAVISVAANIIEGIARGGDRELKRFLNIAFASLAETKYLLKFANKQGYICEKDYQRIYEEGEELSKLLWSLITVLKNSAD